MTGQLGNGSHANTATPSMAIAGAAFVATSDRHACELTTFGEAWCWGANDSGQLGDGTLISTTVPVRAPQLDGAVQLPLGQRHTCMIDAAGAVRCIGSDWRGQLGDGGALLDPTPSPAPISCP